MTSLIDLKNLRSILKKNQTDFAALLGISRQQLSRIERGDCVVSKNVAARYRALADKTILRPTKHVTFVIPDVECPFCDSEEPPVRLALSNWTEGEDSDCVFGCPNCKHVFTQRESARLFADRIG
jgi:transcriptional regulator with XRE-family HTH domain